MNDEPLRACGSLAAGTACSTLNTHLNGLLALLLGLGVGLGLFAVAGRLRGFDLFYLGLLLVQLGLKLQREPGSSMPGTIDLSQTHALALFLGLLGFGHRITQFLHLALVLRRLQRDKAGYWLDG